MAATINPYLSIREHSEREDHFLTYLSGISYLKYRLEKGSKPDFKKFKIETKKTFQNALLSVVEELNNHENLIDKTKLKIK